MARFDITPSLQIFRVALHAWGNVLPFATPTSTCRSRFTICSAVCFFPRAIDSFSHTSLSHLNW
jgi:hypothetical protein